MSATFEVEQLLFEAMECNMYKIPPLQNTAGHKAAEWQDKLIWTGLCKVIAKGSTATVKLLEADGTVFAQCPIQSGASAPKSIIPVVDSSRYFVLRIEDAGRHAYIGIGFRDRDEAFDFKVAITDHKRQETRTESQPVYKGPKQDLELKAGTKIVVNLGGKVKAAEKKNKSFTGLAPPPSRVLPPPGAVPVQRAVPQQQVVPQQQAVPVPQQAPVQPVPQQQAMSQQQHLFQPQAPPASAQPQPNLFSAPTPVAQSQPQPQAQAPDLFPAQPVRQQPAQQNLFQATPTQPQPAQQQSQPQGGDFLLADPVPQQNKPFDPFAALEAPPQSMAQPPTLSYAQQAPPQPQTQPFQQAQPQPQTQQPVSGGDLLDFGPGAQQAKSSVLDAFAAPAPPTQQLNAWDPFA